MLLALAGWGTVFALDFSDVAEVSENEASRGASLSSLGEGEGTGFYMAIYEDVVREPNKQVEEKLKDRFGVDFRVDLSPTDEAGQGTFADFFEDPFASQYSGISAPSFESSLQSDCVRIRASQAQDVGRRWELLKKRLRERGQAFDEGEIPEPENFEQDADEVITRELLNRLIGLVDEESQTRLEEAFNTIPEYRDLSQQDALIRCYNDFSREVDYELKLQSILHPTQQQAQVLQTFMNNRLDDFSDQNSLYGSSFPQYDLLFDIDVIDYILFGSPLSTNIQQSGNGSGFLASSGGSSTAFGQTEVNPFDPSNTTTDGSEQNGGASAAEAQTVPLGVTDLNPTGGFGTSTASFAGPFCSDDVDGEELDFTPLQEREEDTITIAPGLSQQVSGTLPPAEVIDSNPGNIVPDQDVTTAVVGVNDGGEGQFQPSVNLNVLCEGSAGVNFGNDFLKLLFCINIGFEKQGKTWQTTRDENCIACFLYEMNQIFEEYVLSRSVRPHKNTGTIMESAICEDGYGDDIGFHFFLEWTPVKLFPDICYPEGGNGNDAGAREQYAEMVGYPEVLQRVNREGLYVQCEADFKDENSQDRCREAIGGDELTYEQFQQAYVSTLDVENPPFSLDDVDRENVWAKLVGDQGIAEREVHLLLYRLGQDNAQYGEDEVIPQDFKVRLDKLRTRVDEIKRDDSLIVDAYQDQKTAQLLCVKGFSFASAENNAFAQSCNEEDSFAQLEADILAEQNRIMRITQRWNTRSRDFNKQNQCQVFTGSGPIDAFWNTFEDKFDGGYYIQTDLRKTQSLQEQITGQIAENADLSDFESLFSAIESETQTIARVQQRQEQQESFETDQQRSLQLYTAFGAELATFRANMRALTDWWSEMVDEKQFVSKGGQRINVLESFFEKLQ